MAMPQADDRAGKTGRHPFSAPAHHLGPPAAWPKVGTAMARRSHFPQRDFLFAWHAPNFAKNQTQLELAIAGVTGGGTGPARVVRKRRALGLTCAGAC